MARSAEELDRRVKCFGDQLKAAGVFPIAWRAEPYRDPRSLDQNALLHVWLGQFAGHALNVAKPTSEQREAMKIALQRRCYADTGWAYLVQRVVDPFSGEVSVARASTTQLRKGEMCEYLCWIQAFAAEQGLILESRGEYAELQAGQAA